MKSNKHHLRTAPIITLFFIIVCLFATPLFADFQRTKIAVLDFGMIGDKLEPEGIGSILSEWFTTSIVKSGRFDVVERAMLQKIIAEQKLATSGMIDESTASELGKILGVKVIITGSILKLKNMIDINARIISVQSGSIIAAESIRSDADKDYHNLVEQLTAKIMQNFPLTGYIVKKDEKSATVDLGLLSGLASGTEFIVYKEGAVIKHPKTGEVLDVEQIQTGKIRISTVRKNVSIGEILSEQGDGIEYGQLVKSVPQNQNAGMVKSTPPHSRIQTPAPQQPAPVPAPVVATQIAPPPPVVVLKKAQTKKVLASVPAQNPLAEKPSTPDTPIRSEEQPCIHPTAAKVRSRKSCSCFPINFTHASGRHSGIYREWITGCC